MKKAIGILAILMVLGISSAFADTGFTQIGQASGQWKWNGGWTSGNWVTGQLTATGYTATEGATFNYIKTEDIGKEWKYSVASTAQFSAPAQFNNKFEVITLNDPATTPATGGYTQFRYNEVNTDGFGASSLSIVGGGFANIQSNTYLFAPLSTQVLNVGINE